LAAASYSADAGMIVNCAMRPVVCGLMPKVRGRINAFSSEMDIDSREQNASKLKMRR
jgi:hypothetical protein